MWILIGTEQYDAKDDQDTIRLGLQALRLHASALYYKRQFAGTLVYYERPEQYNGKEIV
jgi:hypothetical protein